MRRTEVLALLNYFYSTNDDITKTPPTYILPKDYDNLTQWAFITETS